ncbi:MAG: molybdopterin molybdotransferase MoeA [Notoacmeibacter sp.]|nr:molybdopterin molybdotransferase MoeA [Notoacmeibacter sp.]
MALLPVADALDRLLGGASVCGAETVSISDAAHRILAAPLKALRTQPPFDASAMDGYAVRAADIAAPPARLKLAGESAAGHGFDGVVRSGECVRIFTGAPVPAGADTVILQENVTRLDGSIIETGQAEPLGRHIRRAGLDFAQGQDVLPAGRILDAAAVSLAAAANHATLSVVRRPLVAILATGDELLPPGSATGPGQIIASNMYGVAALVHDAGGLVLDLGIAPDREDAIADAIGKARAAGADVIVTLGGASVGDHDLVQGVLTGLGMELDFWKIAMRPGKPLMVGKLEGVHVIGLPGNPVSSLVCSHLFLIPLVAKLSGRPGLVPTASAVLGAAMPANDQRQDYVRARSEISSSGMRIVFSFDRQDSSMLTTLADADCLIIRPPNARAAEPGETVEILPLRSL